jgi:DivIVA domain-containing protein
VALYITVLLVVAIVAVAAVLLAASGRITGMPDVTHDEAPRPTLQFPVSAADLAGVQFAVRFRGYDMDEVDTLIDSLVDQLAVAEARADGSYLSSTPAAPVTAEPSVEVTAAE